MKIFDLHDNIHVIKVDKKALRIEEKNKRVGRQALWIARYKSDPILFEKSFSIGYRHQTTLDYYDTLEQVKSELEGVMSIELPAAAFDLFNSYVMAKLMVN